MGRFLDEPPIAPAVETYTPKGRFLDEPAEPLGFLKSAIQASIPLRKTISEVVRPSFGPFISEAISPTPVGQAGLKAFSLPFEYGFARPAATALAGWPTMEKEIGKVSKPLDMFGAVGRGLTSETGERLYAQAGYRPELAQPLGSLLDTASMYFLPHMAAKAVSPAYRGMMYAAKKAPGLAGEVLSMPLKVVELFARETGQKAADVRLAWDFVQKQNPNLPLTEKLSITLEALRAIEPPSGVGNIEYPLKRLLGVTKITAPPAISTEVLRPERPPISLQEAALARAQARPVIGQKAPPVAPVAPISAKPIPVVAPTVIPPVIAPVAPSGKGKEVVLPVPTGEGGKILPKVTFKKSIQPSQKDYVLIEVDIGKLNTAWKKDEGYYLEKGEPLDFAQLGERGEIIAANVSLQSNGAISFGDGRHKFAALRDAGYKTAKVSIPKVQLEKFKQFFSIPSPQAGGVSKLAEGRITGKVISVASDEELRRQALLTQDRRYVAELLRRYPKLKIEEKDGKIIGIPAPPKPRAKIGPTTISGDIEKLGGIKPSALAASGHTPTEVRNIGLGHLLNEKTGWGLDDLAGNLHLTIPEDQNPDAYLWELLQTKEGRKKEKEFDFAAQERKRVAEEAKREEEAKEPPLEKAPEAVKPPIVEAKVSAEKERKAKAPEPEVVAPIPALPKVEKPTPEAEAIFIRETRGKELTNPSSIENFAKIPDKEGYNKVYMPFGKQGRGYYYVRKGVEKPAPAKEEKPLLEKAIGERKEARAKAKIAKKEEAPQVKKPAPQAPQKDLFQAEKPQIRPSAKVEKPAEAKAEVVEKGVIGTVGEELKGAPEKEALLKQLLKEYNISAQKRYGEKRPSDVEDIAQEAFQKARQMKYDAKKGKVENYVRASMTDLIDNAAAEVKVSEQTGEPMGRRGKWERAKIEKFRTANPDASLDEIAVGVGIKKDKVIGLLGTKGGLISLQKPIGKEGAELGEVIPAPEKAPPISPIHQKKIEEIRDIIHTSATMEEAYQKVKTTLGKKLKLSLAEFQQYWIAYRGGPSEARAKTILLSLSRSIKPYGKFDIGLTSDLGISGEAAIEELRKVAGISKENMKYYLTHYNEMLRLLLMPQNVLWNSKNPIAHEIAGRIIDYLIRNTAQRVDVLRKVDAIRRYCKEFPEKSDAIFEALRKADRKNDIDFKTFLPKDMNAQDWAVVRAIADLLLETKNRIMAKILKGTMGINARREGYRFKVFYVSKDGKFVIREWLTQGRVDRLKKTSLDVEIIDRKEIWSFRRVVAKEGKVRKETKIFKDMAEATVYEEKLKADLMEQILPYNLSTGPNNEDIQINYIAHFREGEYELKMYEKQENGAEILRHSSMYKKPHEAEAVMRAMRADPQYSDPDVYRMVIKQKENVLQIPHTGTAADVLFFLADSGIDVTSEMVQKFIKRFRSVSTLMSHFIQSHNISGWSRTKEDILKGIERSALAAGRDEFREDMKDLLGPAIDGIDVVHIEDRGLKNIAFNYITAYLLPDESWGPADFGRAFVYTYVLGNKLSACVQNISEGFWAVIGVLRLSKNPAAVFAMKPGKDYAYLYDRAEKEGATSAMMLHQEAHYKMMEAMFIGNRASEKALNVFSFDMGVRLGIQNGVPKDKLYNYAVRFVFNECKPLYRPENKMALLNKFRSGKVLGKYIFPMLSFVMDKYNKFVLWDAKGKFLWMLLAVMLGGIGGLPWGRRLLRKLFPQMFEKAPRYLNTWERLILAGTPGMFGFDPDFLNYVNQVVKGVGNLGWGMEGMLSNVENMIGGMDRYGLAGALSQLPLGGAQFPILGYAKMKKGVIRGAGAGKRVFYEPKTIREKLVTLLLPKTFEYGELLKRERDLKKTWLDRLAEEAAELEEKL